MEYNFPTLFTCSRSEIDLTIFMWYGHFVPRWQISNFVPLASNLSGFREVILILMYDIKYFRFFFWLMGYFDEAN